VGDDFGVFGGAAGVQVPVGALQACGLARRRTSPRSGPRTACGWRPTRSRNWTDDTLINPATGVRVEDVPDSEVADVTKTVARARAAFEQWR
jgi:hypothetical protein